MRQPVICYANLLLSVRAGAGPLADNIFLSFVICGEGEGDTGKCSTLFYCVSKLSARNSHTSIWGNNSQNRYQQSAAPYSCQHLQLQLLGLLVQVWQTGWQ